jgi:hypothetical protein
VVKGLAGIACHLGDRTCMNALAEAVGMVMAGNGQGIEEGEKL